MNQSTEKLLLLKNPLQPLLLCPGILAFIVQNTSKAKFILHVSLFSLAIGRILHQSGGPQTPRDLQKTQSVSQHLTTLSTDYLSTEMLTFLEMLKSWEKNIFFLGGRGCVIKMGIWGEIEINEKNHR